MEGKSEPRQMLSRHLHHLNVHGLMIVVLVIRDDS